MRIAEQIWKARLQGLAISFYTIYKYPTPTIWKEVVDLLKRNGITFFETGLTITLPSPKLSKEVRLALLHLWKMKPTPQQVAQAYAHLRPNLFIVHRASRLSKRDLEMLLSELRGNVDALLLSEGGVEDWEIVREAGFDLVTEVSPTMGRAEMKQAVSYASGFVYLQSAPKTGEPLYPWEKIASTITTIRSMTDVPICCGFGIRDPEQVKRFADLLECDGIIIGSELLKQIRLYQDKSLHKCALKVEQYVKAIIAAGRRRHDTQESAQHDEEA